MEIIKFLALSSTVLLICFSPLIVGGIQDAITRKKILANFAVGNVYGRLEQTAPDNPFAEEVIMDVKRHERDSLMAFNGAFIRVKQDSTVSDLWEEYQRKCKDAIKLVRFRNNEQKR